MEKERKIQLLIEIAQNLQRAQRYSPIGDHDYYKEHLTLLSEILEDTRNN